MKMAGTIVLCLTRGTHFGHSLRSAYYVACVLKMKLEVNTYACSMYVHCSR